MQRYSAQQYEAAWPTTPEPHSNAADPLNIKTAPINVAQLFEDEGVRRASVASKSGKRKADYRPASLRWWYLGSLIAVLVALIAVVVWANLALQGLDTTAKIETRMVQQALEERQNEPTQGDEPAGETDDMDESSATGGPSTEAEEGTLTTALVEVPINITLTGPPITETFTTTTVSFITSDTVITSTQTIPESVITLPPTTPAPLPSGETAAAPPAGSANVVTVPKKTTEVVMTIQGGGSVTTDVVVTTTKPGKEYIELGKTTIFSTFTVDRNRMKIQNSKTRTLTSEIEGIVVTSVETPPPIIEVTVGLDGLPTTSTTFLAPITRISSVPPTKAVITVVSMPTGDTNPLIIVESKEYNLRPAEVFMGKFLPPLVAVILALAVRAVDMTAKLYQPFATLSHPRGASGRDSLTLHFEGWKGFWRPFGMVSKGHPVPLLSTLAVWLSTALAPVACEAIGLKLHGSCVAILAPYRRMANKPQGATRSVLAKKPTYTVTGIYAGLRHRDPLLFGVSCMAVLSDFLPMLFANVPYDLTQTQDMHVVCARTSAGVLVLMAAVLIASMFISWPTFPVDPRSIAGEIWYVAESRWTEKMEDTAVITERERKVALRSMGGRWCYGVIQSSMGDREAVEMDDTYGMIAYAEMEQRPTPLLY
ncbi:uncharacterized protein J7T54_001381 [Emericellopsis cladophorae]|uniref:Uncharacterized protein n=1 Tax=Emericellopsis cladophorae TaxID=2686198 RepID=A0A9Q0BFP7_9HYPO|nr:uncharacterized protein J7T54_001381 [Emericellopsis cladophorae]KAI6782524.1 hypothetical protein J7T54_001381 [Emericellopsis cladophorae]